MPNFLSHAVDSMMQLAHSGGRTQRSDDDDKSKIVDVAVSSSRVPKAKGSNSSWYVQQLDEVLAPSIVHIRILILALESANPSILGTSLTGR